MGKIALYFRPGLVLETHIFSSQFSYAALPLSNVWPEFPPSECTSGSFLSIYSLHSALLILHSTFYFSLQYFPTLLLSGFEIELIVWIIWSHSEFYLSLKHEKIYPYYLSLLVQVFSTFISSITQIYLLLRIFLKNILSNKHFKNMWLLPSTICFSIWSASQEKWSKHFGEQISQMCC